MQSTAVPRHCARVDQVHPLCTSHVPLSGNVPHARSVPVHSVPDHEQPISIVQAASVGFLSHATAKPAHWLNEHPVTVWHSGSVVRVAHGGGAPMHSIGGGPVSGGPASTGSTNASVPASVGGGAASQPRRAMVTTTKSKLRIMRASLWSARHTTQAPPGALHE